MPPSPQTLSQQPISSTWKAALLLLALAVGISTVVIKGFHLFSDDSYEPFIQGADDAHYYLWLRSVVVDGDVHFENDIRETPFLEEHAKQTILAQPLTATGGVINKFPVGWAVVSAPFFWVAHVLAPLTPWPADGFSPPYQVAVWVGHMLIAALGFALWFRILRRWVAADIATIAILLTWLNSPMIYYQSARIAMVHNAVFVLACLLFWLALRISETIRQDHESNGSKSNKLLLLLTLAAGFHAGLLVICRPSALVYLIPPIALILTTMLRHLRASPGLCTAMVAAAIFGALAGVFPQLLAWKQLYGSWIFYSYQGEGFHWMAPQFFTSLWSAHHGLFNWHPVLLLGLASLLAATVRNLFPASWIATAVLIIWVNSAWHMVYFGSSFGGRAYEFLVFFASLGLAFLLQYLARAQHWRTSLMLALTLAAIWNALFLYVFMRGYVSRELPVTWSERMEAVGSLFSEKSTPAEESAESMATPDGSG